jgi:uncharacterized protein (TIGR04255 family)
MQPQKEPPVSEAVCEVRFADGQSWDWTVPGLFYSQLKHEFPKRREQRYLKGEPVSLLFLREDERVQIQIGANALSVKHLSPYSGWEHFRAMIERALIAYLQASHPAHIQSVSLRYVYHFRAPVPLPEGGFPTLPPSIASAPQRWLHQLTVPYVNSSEILTIQSETVAESNGSEPHTQLEVALTREFRDATSLETCLQWLDRAHAIVVALGETSTMHAEAPARVQRAPFALDIQAFSTGAVEEPSLPPPTRITATAHLHKVVPAPFQLVDDFAESPDE